MREWLDLQDAYYDQICLHFSVLGVSQSIQSPVFDQVLSTGFYVNNFNNCCSIMKANHTHSLGWMASSKSEQEAIDS